MQRIALLLLVIASGAAGAATEVGARTWLRAHDNPSGDELAELKTANPDAYAIVKALLTKRSLGLLDPKHPSASFAAPPPSAENEPVGAAAFAKFASPGELDGHADLPVDDSQVEAPRPAAHHGDWLNWKPADSASDDDAMVKNVLGNVAQLVGNSGSKNLRSSSASASPLDNDASDILSDDDAQPAASQQQQPPAPHENSYLKGIDLDSDTATSNKNLGLDTPADTPVAVVAVKQTVSEGSSGDLSSFSFDDHSAQVETTAAPRTQEKAASQNSLDSWLGDDFDSKPKKALVQKKEAVAAPSNPYLSALQ